MTTAGPRVTRCAETSKSLVGQAGTIALQANDRMAQGSYDSAQWAKSAHQLANLALAAGLAATKDLMAFRCLPQCQAPSDLSDFIVVEPDSDAKRALSVAGPFTADGAPSVVIPDRHIVFVPDTLRIYATRFRVGVTWPGLVSGTYRGRVRLTNEKTGAVTVEDVIIDL